MSSLAKDQFEKIKEKHKKDFNIWAWLLRLVMLSLAFAGIVMYLRDHNREKEILLEEVREKRIENESSTTENEKRPNMQIPVFRAKGK